MNSSFSRVSSRVCLIVASALFLTVSGFAQGNPPKALSVSNVFGARTEMAMYVDITGAQKSGFSKKLSYLTKTQKVSVGWLHEYFYGAEDQPDVIITDERSIHRLEHEPSVDNVGDLLTKPLGVERHAYLTNKVGMRSLATIARL